MSDALIVNLDGVLSEVDISTSFGQFSVDKTGFERLSGWSLKPEGLCKGAVCIPVNNSQLLSDGMNIDLVEFSRIVNQNIVVDSQYRVAAVGEQAPSRAGSMKSLDAPNFTLPNIHGKQVSFSDFNRRKRLLLAWSSW